MRIQGNTHSTYDPVHCIFVYTLTFKTNEQKPRKECIFFLYAFYIGIHLIRLFALSICEYGYKGKR